MPNNLGANMFDSDSQDSSGPTRPFNGNGSRFGPNVGWVQEEHKDILLNNLPTNPGQVTESWSQSYKI
jgi:hypothetical protein